MNIVGAIAVESLSSALSVTRGSVRQLFDDIEEAVSSSRARLTARLDQALSASAPASARSGEVENIAEDFLQNEAKPAVLKHMLGVAGANLGLLSVLGGASAWVVVGGGTALVTLAGVAVTPALLVLVGFVLMVVCGRYSIDVMRNLTTKLMERISSAATSHE